MKKILFLVNHDVVIYNFRLELVEALLNRGDEVFISSPYGERIDELVRIGCKYREISMNRHGMNPLEEIKLIRAYKELLDEISPDIVFSYTIKPNIYGAIACKSRRIPIVCNITGLGTAVENPGIRQKIMIALYRYAFTNVQKVFFQNQANMQFFVDHKLAIGKHDLLPGSGVNLIKFQPLVYPSENVTRFVFISRIMKEKGIDYYLEAARFIKERYPCTEFHVCGFVEKEYKGKLTDYEKNGIIINHGMVRDVREILKFTNCTVFPSYYPEGLSNVLLESAACSRPIITTDRAGCREAIDNDRTGFLIPVNNQKALDDAIERFLCLSREKQEQMGLLGRKKVEREFDRNIIVNQYLMELENG